MSRFYRFWAFNVYYIIWQFTVITEFYYFLDYVGPNERRRANTLGRKEKSYFNKVVAKEHKEKMKAEVPEAPKHVTDDIFVNNWKSNEKISDWNKNLYLFLDWIGHHANFKSVGQPIRLYFMRFYFNICNITRDQLNCREESIKGNIFIIFLLLIPL